MTVVGGYLVIVSIMCHMLLPDIAGLPGMRSEPKLMFREEIRHSGRNNSLDGRRAVR